MRSFLVAILIAASVACAGTGGTEPKPEAPSQGSAKRANESWFVKHEDSDTVLVFVHGIFSNSSSCWTSGGGKFWPELIASDPKFVDARGKSPSIFLAGYHTAIDSGGYDADQCSREVLLGLQEHGVLSSSVHKILFVAHSTGGIVVRHILTHNWGALGDKRIGLALYASPSNGSGWATVTSGLQAYYGNRLAEQLQPGNSYLRDLDRQFRDLLQSTRSTDALTGIEVLEHHFIVKSRFLPEPVPVVDADSGNRYFGIARILPGTDHFTIVKPNSVDDDSHQILRAFFAGSFDLTGKQRALAEACQSLGLAVDSARTSGTVSKVLDGAMPWTEDYEAAAQKFIRSWRDSGDADRRAISQIDLYKALAGATKYYRGIEASQREKAQSIAWAQDVLTYFFRVGNVEMQRQAALDAVAIFLDLGNQNRSSAEADARYMRAMGILQPFLQDGKDADFLSQTHRLASRLAYDHARPIDGNLSRCWEAQALRQALQYIDDAIRFDPNEIKNYTQKIRVLRQLHSRCSDNVLDAEGAAIANALAPIVRDRLTAVRTSEDAVPPMHALSALNLDLLIRDTVGSDDLQNGTVILPQLDKWLGEHEQLRARILASGSLGEEWAFDLLYDRIRARVLRYLLVRGHEGADSEWNQVMGDWRSLSELSRRRDLVRIQQDLKSDAVYSALTKVERDEMARTMWGFLLDPTPGKKQRAHLATVK